MLVKPADESSAQSNLNELLRILGKAISLPPGAERQQLADELKYMLFDEEPL
jgi:hypothetical protein